MAVRNLLQLFLVGGLLLLFSGCLPKQDDVKTAFQSNAAAIIKKDQKRLQKLIIKLKTKLDKRNPNSFDGQLNAKIYTLINGGQNSFYLTYKKEELKEYKTYLDLAFSKEKIKYRTDYLILGIYYQFYEAYNLQNKHKVFAMEYDKEKLARLHKNLQALKWKLKTQKNLNGEYLYLTWQNNWQIELEKKLKANPNFNYEEIKNLKYIKEKKESLLDHSNLSFEVTLTQMIDCVGNSLFSLGEEPKELTVKALFFFI